MSRFMLSVIAALWMVAIIPFSAMAQTKEPGPPPEEFIEVAQGLPALPDGGSLYFIPNLMKAAPRPWTVPELMLLHAGTNSQVQSSSTDAWCVNLLDANMVQASSEICLGGTLYPALVNKNKGVSAAGWQNGNAIAVQGEALNQGSPQVLDKRVLLGPVLLDEGNLFVWGKEQKIGIVPFSIPSPSEVTAAQVQQTLDEILLLQRLTRLGPDFMRVFGVPVPVDLPVYNYTGEYYTTLAGKCSKDLDGSLTWPWYFMGVNVSARGALLEGVWAKNPGFIPGFQERVRSCMLGYQYFRFDQIRDHPAFESFRQYVMSAELLAEPRPNSYRIESWGDDELAGAWYMSIFPAGAGAVIVTAQYLKELGGVLQPIVGVANSTLAWLIIPNPDSNLLCGVLGDPDTCTLKQIQ